MNQSKKNKSAIWNRWRKSGAVSFRRYDPQKDHHIDYMKEFAVFFGARPEHIFEAQYKLSSEYEYGVVIETYTDERPTSNEDVRRIYIMKRTGEILVQKSKDFKLPVSLFFSLV